MLMKKKTGQGNGPDLPLLVELPGIEPAAETALNCENDGF